jgi:hypothetical protein
MDKAFPPLKTLAAIQWRYNVNVTLFHDYQYVYNIVKHKSNTNPVSIIYSAFYFSSSKPETFKIIQNEEGLYVLQIGQLILKGIPPCPSIPELLQALRKPGDSSEIVLPVFECIPPSEYGMYISVNKKVLLWQ